jgi:hypothetical protein
MAEGGEDEDEDVHAVERILREAATTSSTAYDFFCNHDHPVNKRWAHRRTTGRLFGIAVGFLAPLFVSVALLARSDSFRGTALSARILIRDEVEGYLVGAGDTGTNASEALDTYHLAALRGTMDAVCWNVSGAHEVGRVWTGPFTQCTTANGFAGVGPVTIGQSIWDVNPWGLALGTFMFGLLYTLWLKIFTNEKIDKWLEDKAMAALGLASKAQDGLKMVAGLNELTEERMRHRTDFFNQHQNARLVVFLVSFAICAVGGYATVHMIQGLAEHNLFGNYSVVFFEDGHMDIDVKSALVSVAEERSGLKFLPRQLLAFFTGMLCGGGLIGAPIGSALATYNQEGKIIAGNLYPFLFSVLLGTCFGLVTLFTEDALNNSAASLLDPTVRSRRWIQESAEAFTSALELDEKADTEYFAVQFHKLRREREVRFRSDVVQLVVVLLCSLCWDCFVVTFHVLRPPHPKHRLRADRRLSIYTHIFSGCGEIVCSVISIYLYDEGLPNDNARLRFTYLTACCSFMHAITGAYQTPQVIRAYEHPRLHARVTHRTDPSPRQVFGMQCVMVPAYGVVVLWKVVKATQLVLDPESLLKLMELFFIHHIYVWCRAFVFIFEQMGIFDDVTYTLAIMVRGLRVWYNHVHLYCRKYRSHEGGRVLQFAGFVCGPLTMGPAGNLMVMAAICMYNFLLAPYKENPDTGKIERRMNMFLNAKWRRHIDQLARNMCALWTVRYPSVRASN